MNLQTRSGLSKELFKPYSNPLLKVFLRNIARHFDNKPHVVHVAARVSQEYPRRDWPLEGTFKFLIESRKENVREKSRRNQALWQSDFFESLNVVLGCV